MSLQLDDTEKDKQFPSNVEVNDIEIEDLEHREYLQLCQEFEGEKLHKLTRKIDLRVIPQLIFIHLLSYVDRSNVGNAKLFGAQTNLGMSAQDWNTGLTLLFITYAIFVTPSNVIVKRFGPRRVLPTLLVLIGIILVGAGCTSNKGGWYALRLTLGAVEAGIYPGSTYTLTTWYTPQQIQSRANLFYQGGVLAGAFSGLLAFGIGQLDYTWGYRGWRFIYVIEGVFTTIVGVAAYFAVRETPQKCGSWLSDEEKRFLLLRSRYAYGGCTVGVKDEFSWKDVGAALKSWHSWTMGLCLISATISIFGFSLSLPTIISNMGFTNTNAQLLSVPPYVVGSFGVFISGFLSDKYQKRMVNAVICGAIGCVGLFIIIFTVSEKRLIPLSYMATCIIAGGIYPLIPAFTTWCAVNSAGQTKRAAAMAVTVFCGNIGGAIGSNIYLAKEAPKYPSGFGSSIACTGFGCVIVPIVYAYAVGRVNKKRDAMNTTEIAAKYTEQDLHEMGDLSPLYRYSR